MRRCYRPCHSSCCCCCCYLFLRIDVWQPFRCCWRLIIARVSEMHVAYHRHNIFLGYLHHWNKTNNRPPPLSSVSFLIFLFEAPISTYKHMHTHTHTYKHIDTHKLQFRQNLSQIVVQWCRAITVHDVSNYLIYHNNWDFSYIRAQKHTKNTIQPLRTV